MNSKIIKVAKIISTGVLVIGAIVLIATLFLVGFIRGYGYGKLETDEYYKNLITDKVSSTSKSSPEVLPTVSLKPKVIVTPKPNWGGPQLWEAVNSRRTQLGVNPLSSKSEVCTIASIRLNQILELGKLDAHLGFSNLPTDRLDLKYIFDKYNLSEFLVSGAGSAQEAVSLWENTLGHRELLTGGQYVWGCTYAQNGFGVAIAAY